MWNKENTPFDWTIQARIKNYDTEKRERERKENEQGVNDKGERKKDRLSRRLSRRSNYPLINRLVPVEKRSRRSGYLNYPEAGNVTRV